MAAGPIAIHLRKAASLRQRRLVHAQTEKRGTRLAHPTAFGALVLVEPPKAARPMPQSLALVPMGKMANAHAAVPVYGAFVRVLQVVPLEPRSLVCVVVEKVGRKLAKQAVNGRLVSVKAQAFALREQHRLAHAPREPRGRNPVIPKGAHGWSASASPQKNPPSHESHPKKGQTTKTPMSP